MRIDGYTLGFQSHYESHTLSAARVTQKGEMVHTLSLHHEEERLLLAASGSVSAGEKTIDFALSTSLEREERYRRESLVHQSAIDPLVIGLDGRLSRVDSDRTFRFDLNSDGTQEMLSSLSSNSAFLALDHNHNGMIDDGSELFGTRSGDGFADLAAYDEDHNGVIDSNDAVFDRLQLWQKSALKENLISLSSAKVGALLLESVASPFSFSNEGEKQASLRSSSVVLFEDGRAGWISHLDFFVTQEASATFNANVQRGVEPQRTLPIPPQAQHLSLNTHESLISMLEKRLHQLEAKLSKTHDKTQKAALQLQIMAINEQISRLEMV